MWYIEYRGVVGLKMECINIRQVNPLKGNDGIFPRTYLQTMRSLVNHHTDNVVVGDLVDANLAVVVINRYPVWNLASFILAPLCEVNTAMSDQLLPVARFMLCGVIVRFNTYLIA